MVDDGTECTCIPSWEPLLSGRLDIRLVASNYMYNYYKHDDK